MASNHEHAPGAVVGFDLAVPDAESIRDFYASVIGWESEPFDMGGYSDYFMKAPGEENPVAGICHSRGENADMPAQWLSYMVVADLDASLQSCTEGGGALVSAIKGNEGEQRYCVLRDPAGAYMALLEFGAEDSA